MTRKDKRCPLCGRRSFKIVYFGLPHRLCEDEQCSCLFGFWANLTVHLPFNGWFFVYEGAYLPALWRWLRMGVRDDA